MAQTRFPLYTAPVRVAAGLACLVLAGCVYRIDIQQGNLLEADAVEQVEVGMTRGAVRFLLGTPMVADPFHAGRWDYPYYLRRGRSSEATRSWVVIFFEDDRVSRIERDVNLDPAS